MAEFSIIKASEAPAASKANGRLKARMSEYEGFVAGVGSGKVGKLKPSSNESARGLALRVSHAAKRMGKSVNTWVVNDTLYFSVN